MTAATIPRGTDLDLIIFGEEERRPGCTFCPREAAYTGLFEPLRSCPHTEWPYCLPHAQEIQRLAVADGPEFGCRGCGTPWNELRFLKMEPIR